MPNLLRDDAYEALCDLIARGGIAPNTIYSLNALAAELGMSRTPVRDAVQRLSDEGRLDVLPSRGFRLHSMSAEEAERHFHVSCAIEGYCAAELARCVNTPAGADVLAELRGTQVELGKRADMDEDFAAYFAADQSFHRTLLCAVGDGCFLGFANSPAGFYAHPELQQVAGGVTRTEVLRCHADIIDAIARGDAPGAYEAMRRHAQLMRDAWRALAD